MAEHGDRAAFLGRMRMALAGGAPANPIRPLTPLPAGRLPSLEYAVDLSDMRTRFTEAATAAGAVVRSLGSPEDVAALVTELVAAHHVRRAAVSGDPECATVPDVLSAFDVDVIRPGDVQAVAGADLGITGAVAGVALTGSVVVDSTRAGGRTASVLPPVHLALVSLDALVATPGDVFRGLGRRADDLPSNLVFITGPSRSADIELVITLGVHGPHTLWIGLIG
ncbi:MAG TPA: lactate utilization protein [Acidimicrobiales bacterium]|nr:lactate utilization protein [Acidimicrobiales bacterium]